MYVGMYVRMYICMHLCIGVCVCTCSRMVRVQPLHVCPGLSLHACSLVDHVEGFAPMGILQRQHFLASQAREGALTLLLVCFNYTDQGQSQKLVTSAPHLEPSILRCLWKHASKKRTLVCLSTTCHKEADQGHVFER